MGKHGIVSGMSLAEALALASIPYEKHDPLADDAALLKLAAACEEFSPMVGVERPDTLCLNITGLDVLFGSERSLAEQAVNAFRRQRISVRAAVAGTLGAAWALANYGRERTAIVPSGMESKALYELPLQALRLSEQSVETLYELGIERIGELMKLRRNTLVSRFGPDVIRRIDQATGAIPEPVTSYRPPPDIAAEVSLEYPAQDRLQVEAILSELAERIAKMMAARQLGAIQLECRLQCENAEPVTFLIGLFRASAIPRHLLGLIRTRLEQVRLPSPVTAIRLSVLTAVPIEPEQQELFDVAGNERRRQVALLVDRLSSRIGREAVVRAVPRADAQPECAFRLQPLTGARPRKVKADRWRSLPRPARLEPEPVPLNILSVAPDGPPIQFQYGGLHRIVHAWGPERIQTGWWRGQYVQRDYYRVETTTGQRYWIFRRLHDAKWFLHGAFD